MSASTPTTTFDERVLAALPEAPAFVAAIRGRAFEAFRTLPLPSQQTEEWRYTDVSGFVFDQVPAGAESSSAPEVLDGVAADLGERAGLRLQYGRATIERRLDPALEARGVLLLDLDRAAAEHPELVEPHLHDLVPVERSVFTALHGAFRVGGTFLYVPPDVQVELPIETVTGLGEDRAAVFPHTLLVADRGSEVTLIDRYVSPPLAGALSDAVVELVVGEGAHVRYVSLQEWGSGVTHLAVQRAVVGRDAQLRTLGVALGASLARAEVEVELAGDGSSTELLGVYFGDGQQHIDHRSIQLHRGSRSASDLLYKGALKDAASAIYTGTVIVDHDAHRCDAYQTNRNILLSDRARAMSVPNLEILTNDPTRCGHAASVGPVSEDVLFYLQSRGISREEAERLVVFGFFNEVLDRIDLADIRTSLERAIADELRGGS
ncbi:MAG: Fe-S cluster assembly protein SufD [Actinomycetota bacterium]|nr:MAG: Fe-S cluster assembly protein SufD [Actinomycetota bacterium]